MLGTEILFMLSTRLALGCIVGTITPAALILGCSASTATTAIAPVTIPSVLFLMSFSSREAALSKSKAYKRTRIDKEKKNKKTEGPFAL